MKAHIESTDRIVTVKAIGFEGQTKARVLEGVTDGGNGRCRMWNSCAFGNSHSVMDGDRETGIGVSDSGHVDKPDSHKRRVTYKGKEYPLLRDAVFAYEDDLAAVSENVPQ